MELTGKCKEDFQRWYFKNHCGGSLKYDELLPHHMVEVYEWFYEINDSFKWGVLVDFFEENNIWIEILFDHPNWGYQVFCLPNNYKNPIRSVGGYKSIEARKESIKKANEIYNSK